MNKKFNVISENNLEYIDFHDCECSRLYYENDTLIFEMEWMEVLAEHPMNPYNKAHQSDEGMVLLQLPKIEQLILYKNDSEIISANDFENVDFRNIILLQYDEYDDKSLIFCKFLPCFAGISISAAGTVHDHQDGHFCGIAVFRQIIVDGVLQNFAVMQMLHRDFVPAGCSGRGIFRGKGEDPGKKSQNAGEKGDFFHNDSLGD